MWLIVLILATSRNSNPSLSPFSIYQSASKERNFFVRIELQSQTLAFIDLNRKNQHYTGVAKINDRAQLVLSSALQQTLAAYHIHHLHAYFSETADAVILKGMWYIFPFNVKLTRISKGVSPEMTHALHSLAISMIETVK